MVKQKHSQVYIFCSMIDVRQKYTKISVKIFPYKQKFKKLNLRVVYPDFRIKFAGSVFRERWKDPIVKIMQSPFFSATPNLYCVKIFDLTMIYWWKKMMENRNRDKFIFVRHVILQEVDYHNWTCHCLSHFCRGMCLLRRQLYNI